MERIGGPSENCRAEAGDSIRAPPQGRGLHDPSPPPSQPLCIPGQGGPSETQILGDITPRPPGLRKPHFPGDLCSCTKPGVPQISSCRTHCPVPPLRGAPPSRPVEAWPLQRPPPLPATLSPDIQPLDVPTPPLSSPELLHWPPDCLPSAHSPPTGDTNGVVSNSEPFRGSQGLEDKNLSSL